jgi:hypothetical protein
MENSKNDGACGAEQSMALTHEEHKARAMLLGMVYHHGNGGDPFYYKVSEDGIPITESLMDANTLEYYIKKEGELSYKILASDTLGKDKVMAKHHMMWETRDPPVRIKK